MPPFWSRLHLGAVIQLRPNNFDNRDFFSAMPFLELCFHGTFGFPLDGKPLRRTPGVPVGVGAFLNSIGWHW